MSFAARRLMKQFRVQNYKKNIAHSFLIQIRSIICLTNRQLEPSLINLPTVSW